LKREPHQELLLLDQTKFGKVGFSLKNWILNCIIVFTFVCLKGWKSSLTIYVFHRNTTDKLSLANEIQEVRKSQEFLNEKYEKMMKQL